MPWNELVALAKMAEERSLQYLAIDIKAMLMAHGLNEAFCDKVAFRIQESIIQEDFGILNDSKFPVLPDFEGRFTFHQELVFKEIEAYAKNPRSKSLNLAKFIFNPMVEIFGDGTDL